ncbi:hypothetical protein [Flavobacterium sp.]|jgi:hypothetical protein|uniref:hypothetical protein n=1 Tax=Flavobacterium sp. TaxID=239 RepID=UPI0037C19059
MTTNAVLLLLLSVLLAGGVSFFQYFYKTKNQSKINWLLAFLRFFSIFGLLLLLLNPRISSKSYETIKPPLPIIVDNSSSVNDLGATSKAQEVYQKLIASKALQQKYAVQSYGFSSEMESMEQFDFKGSQTKLFEVGKNLKSIYKSSLFPTVIITDGNQTIGNDYVYSFDSSNAVYPIVLGDTATVMDLKISQLNVNKYAFLKNKFPVEVFLSYSGTKALTTKFSISKGNSILTSQNVTFSPNQRSQRLNVILPAESVGVQVYQVKIISAMTEKNTYNNTKNFAIEVIDQKSEIALVTSFNHPDVGMLKRSLEGNLQRKVTVIKPSQINSLQDFNVLILYQPTNEFKSVFDKNKSANLNTLVITGTQTDFAFLNQQQSVFEFKMSSEREDYMADFQSTFNLFATENIDFENLPPLQHSFGTISTKKQVEVLLKARIRNVPLDQPLLAFSENQGSRTAFLIGENLWKWRLKSHSDTQSFEKFDVFLDKTIQFLASSNTRKNLVVTHENFYNSGDAIEISAQYFNKNYEFDEKARLTITAVNKNTKQTKRYDLLKSANSYKVNLDGLEAGAYSFTVKELTSNASYSGQFDVLDFDIEKQFVNPDVMRLMQLTTQTKGQLYLPNQVDDLIQSLLSNENYKTIEKETVKKTPTIEWIWLLVLIALSLAAEWFIRKYNGLL